VTLAIVLMAALINVLDNTVLNVAIPTIQRDLDTDLATLQWVLTGYSLTFATLLIIGGRLGDIYGPRRTFIIGAALFGAGSLVASEANSVAVLLVGEAVIEGVGASLMLPATLAIISTTFRGAERASAFAAWGAVAGSALAFGPLLGGFLTTEYSWRWSLRINVVVAPLAVLGAIMFMRDTSTRGRQARVDVAGALLVALGMFLLVFALSEGGRCGWFRPLAPLTLGSWEIWPATRSISVIPLLAGASALLLGCFAAVEWVKERRRRGPLFELGLLHRRSFRYGLMTLLVLAMGQLGFIFVLSVLLQDGRHLSAIETGIWFVPWGVSIVVGAQSGARLTRYVDTTYVVRAGLTLEAAGLVAITFAVSPDVTFFAFLPGMVLFGLGLGFASSQLNNVMLREIPKVHAGSASGANTTVRQLGGALGIAVMGSLVTTETMRHAAAAIGASELSGVLKDRAMQQLHVTGVGFASALDISGPDASLLRKIGADAIVAGVRPALVFCTGVVVVGALLSTLIPRVGRPVQRAPDEPFDVLELDGLEAAVAD